VRNEQEHDQFGQERQNVGDGDEPAKKAQTANEAGMTRVLAFRPEAQCELDREDNHDRGVDIPEEAFESRCEVGVRPDRFGFERQRGQADQHQRDDRAAEEVDVVGVVRLEPVVNVGLQRRVLALDQWHKAAPPCAPRDCFRVSPRTPTRALSPALKV
jgi:hypothetical protein